MSGFGNFKRLAAYMSPEKSTKRRRTTPKSSESWKKAKKKNAEKLSKTIPSLFKSAVQNNSVLKKKLEPD
jgi:hypothetical protein